MASTKGFGGGNTPFSSKTKKKSSSSLPVSSKPTGLVNSKGQAVVAPKIGTQGVNIAQSVASGGIKVASPSTGLVGVGGKPVKSPNFSSGGRSSGVNINKSLNSGGLVLGATTSVATPINRLSSNASFGGGSIGGSNLASNTPNIPSSNVINTPTLGAQNTKLTFPEQTVPDYSQLIPTPQEQVVADATKTKDTALQDLLDTIKDPPSSADAYKKAQRETGILKKQQEVNDLTGTLNGIVAKGEANQLALIGQGRGIPEAIIGGQQAQIARETAIAALPVQAQLSAATGALESAEQSLDTLYKIYSQDAQNEYEYKREVKKLVYESASEKEKRALEKLDKQEERDYEEKQAVLKDIKDIGTEAMKNQAPANVLSSIFKAKTYEEAVTAAGKYGGGYLERELILQQIANVKSQIAERSMPSDKPQTAAQSSANGYANRVAEADVIISNLGKKFTDTLAIGGLLPNRFQSADRQMYEQAKRNFITSVLRRESGAAISESEFVTAEKQYFPQSGDKPETLLQKESSRNTTINNLYREAGVNRPVLPGQIIESNGVRYRVGMDGETLDIIQQ